MPRRLWNSKEEPKQFARKLRKDSPKSEQIIWQALRSNRIGFGFRRQHPLGIYVLDFFCYEANLCVEVDGEQHVDRSDKDLVRDNFLDELGILTLRIPSIELFGESNVWVETIYALCCERTGRCPFG